MIVLKWVAIVIVSWLVLNAAMRSSILALDWLNQKFPREK